MAPGLQGAEENQEMSVRKAASTHARGRQNALACCIRVLGKDTVLT